MRYWYLQLKIQCGEYEFYSKSVQKTPLKEEFDDDAYAQDFYDGGEDEYDNGTYYSNCGNVAVAPYSLQEITYEEFEIMNRYL